MTLILVFGFGCVAGSLVTHYWPKVRGALGAARDGILGKPRAPARTITETKAPKEKLTADKVLSNFGQFFAWCAENWKWIALVLIALFIVFAMRSCGESFGWGKSKGELRLERELAEANARVLQIENERDAEIAQVARDVAVIRSQIRIASQRGHDEIAAAAPANEAPIDAGLVAAFRRSLDGLCIQRRDSPLPDSCGSGA